jgi:hypothetical protein
VRPCARRLRLRERGNQQGRITATADIGTTALSVIATAHLLLAGELGAQPTTDAILEVTGSILVGIERNP